MFAWSTGLISSIVICVAIAISILVSIVGYITLWSWGALGARWSGCWRGASGYKQA